MDPSRARWLQATPFLIPMARFQELLAGAAAQIPAPVPSLPPLDAHAEAYRAGVPLLAGASHGPALQAAGAAALRDLSARTAALDLPRPIAEGLAEVRAALAAPGAAEAAVAWLVRGEEGLFLCDWPTLALDAMAAERGYQRRGASLYELERRRRTPPGPAGSHGRAPRPASARPAPGSTPEVPG